MSPNAPPSTSSPPATAELLGRWVEDACEKSFAELVERYSGLVYGTAMRSTTGQQHLSSEIAQQVFIALAGKAASLQRDERLGAWLHRRAIWTANNLMRSERRRTRREQAASMTDSSHTDSPWEDWSPHLDRALGKLKKSDRDAIVLRYIEGRDFRSVGDALGASEEAARKRVSRGLEKLRAILGKRGMTLGAATLTSAFAQQTSEAAVAAPANLIAEWSSASIKVGGAGAGAALFSSWLTPLISAGLGVGLTIALGSTPLFSTGKSSSEELDPRPRINSTAIAGEAEAPMKSAAVDKQLLTLDEFVRELKLVASMPHGSVRTAELRRLVYSVELGHGVTLGRAIVREVNPMLLDVHVAGACRSIFGRDRVPPKDRFLFFTTEWPHLNRNRSTTGNTIPSNAFRDWMEEDEQGAIAWIEQARSEGKLREIAWPERPSHLLAIITDELRESADLEKLLELQIAWANSGDSQPDVRSFKLETEADFRRTFQALGSIEVPRAKHKGQRDFFWELGSSRQHLDLARELVDATPSARDRATFAFSYSGSYFNTSKMERLPDYQTVADWCLSHLPEEKRASEAGVIASQLLYGNDSTPGQDWLGKHPEYYSEEVLSRLERERRFTTRYVTPEQAVTHHSSIITALYGFWHPHQPEMAAGFLQRSLVWLEENGVSTEQLSPLKTLQKK